MNTSKDIRSSIQKNIESYYLNQIISVIATDSILQVFKEYIETEMMSKKDGWYTRSEVVKILFEGLGKEKTHEDEAEVIKNFRERFGFLYKMIEKFAIPNAKAVNWGEEIESFLLEYGEKCRKEERERIKEVVSIEIEAWFGAHDEMEKSFMSEDMIKQIVKRMEEV